MGNAYHWGTQIVLVLAICGLIHMKGYEPILRDQLSRGIILVTKVLNFQIVLQRHSHATADKRKHQSSEL